MNRKRRAGLILAATMIIVSWGGRHVEAQAGRMDDWYRPGPVTGRMIDAGFLYGETNYHAVQLASDGKVYYAIGSHAHGQSASLFRYDPRTGTVKLLGSMNRVTGEDGTKVFNQDKIHCDLYEMNGKLWFSTQGGSYGGGNYGPYPGGHFFSYDLATGTISDLGIGAPGEGVVAMAMDTRRGRMYGITWPRMLLVACDTSTGEIRNYGKQVATPGIDDLTSVPGNRSLGIDPRSGNVYWHNMDGTISRYVAARDTVELLREPRLDLPLFRIERSGFNAALWRSIRWNESMGCFYGVETSSEYLFSFDPERSEIEVIDRIAAGPNRRTGKLGGASLAFEFGPDGRVLYYITGTRGVLPDGSIRPELHLVTCDLMHRKYTDHGPIALEDGRYPTGCSGLEVGADGNLYLVCSIPLNIPGGERERRIIDAHFSGTPKEKLPGAAYEMNLVIVPDPLRR